MLKSTPSLLYGLFISVFWHLHLVSCGKSYLSLLLWEFVDERIIINVHLSHCETEPGWGTIQQRYMFGQFSHVNRAKKCCIEPSVRYRKEFCDGGFRTLREVGVFLVLPGKGAKSS